MKTKTFIAIILLATLSYAGSIKDSTTDNSVSGTSIKDIDGNIYNTVKIGYQVWMKENLKTTKYNDGTPIPNIKVDSTWEALKTGAYSDYDNNPRNSTTYGRLYNWYAVSDARKLCPTGWHVPTDAEWTTLENYLIANGYNWDGTITGNKIAKSMASTSGWTTFGPNNTVGDDQASNNRSRFTAFPSGSRFDDGTYGNVGLEGNWWSSTENAKATAYNRDMSHHDSFISRRNYYKAYGFSVRCLHD